MKFSVEIFFGELYENNVWNYGFDCKITLIFTLVSRVEHLKKGCLNKTLKTTDLMCPPFLSFMLASAEEQCPAAGAFQSAAVEGGPAGLCIRS